MWPHLALVEFFAGDTSDRNLAQTPVSLYAEFHCCARLSADHLYHLLISFTADCHIVHRYYFISMLEACLPCGTFRMHMSHIQRRWIADSFCSDTQRHTDYTIRRVGITSVRP